MVPCFNEEEALAPSAAKLLDKLHELMAKQIVGEKSRIVFVDDGSKDRTWDIIKGLYEEYEEIKGLRFAHNRGHQNAILAGMMYAVKHCDYTITIDADLQQDVNAMESFISAYMEGSEIVYGVRNSRDTDKFFKKLSATMFYKAMKVMDCNIYENSADYRLMSKKALTALSEYGEVNLFLRGIIPQIGLRTDIVKYDRHERVAGESKYPLAKMLSFSIDGITSFSSTPIRMIFLLGIILLILDVIMSIYVFISYFGHDVIPGWTSLMLSVWFLGSLILIGLGVVGEYIGKIFVEVKHRPRYAIRDYLID